MPKPSVNQSRDMPSAQPTMSLALLVQVGGIPGLPGACSIIGYRKRKAGDGIIASPHAAEKYQQRKARDLNPRSTPRTALGLSEPARIDPHGCCPFSEEIRLG